jgi:hypothetical protein
MLENLGDDGRVLESLTPLLERAVQRWYASLESNAAGTVATKLKKMPHDEGRRSCNLVSAREFKVRIAIAE